MNKYLIFENKDVTHNTYELSKIKKELEEIDEELDLDLFCELTSLLDDDFEGKMIIDQLTVGIGNKLRLQNK